MFPHLAIANSPNTVLNITYIPKTLQLKRDRRVYMVYYAFKHSNYVVNM